MGDRRIFCRVVLSGLLLLACPLALSAQQKGKLLQAWNALQARLDSSAQRKVDARYIEVPDKPWRVVLRTKANGIDMKVESVMDHDYLVGKGLDDDGITVSWDTRINPPVAASAGFYVGYRGLGFSYSTYFRQKTGRYISFSSTGAKYGLNFRLRRFKTSDVFVDLVVDEDGKRQELHGDAQLYDAVMVRSVIVDGYYLFNGKRFSQAAAYNQSVIQKRSAGSLMLGALYHQSSLDFADKLNAGFIQFNGDVGKFSIRQVNLGVGYGYNWVPARGWLFNAMVMPTVSVYSRTKFHYYDSNYSLFVKEEKDGKKSFVPNDASWQDDVELWETSTESNVGRWQLNADARASVSYSWKRYFLNVFGQLNHFGYSYSTTDVNLTDWHVSGSFGVRF